MTDQYREGLLDCHPKNHQNLSLSQMIVTDIPNDPEESGFTSYRAHSAAAVPSFFLNADCQFFSSHTFFGIKRLSYRVYIKKKVIYDPTMPS